MVEPLRREQLDQERCGTPGCDCDRPLVFNTACHSSDRLNVSYDRDSGALSIFCAICKEFVCKIEVAK